MFNIFSFVAVFGYLNLLTFFLPNQMRQFTFISYCIYQAIRVFHVLHTHTKLYFHFTKKMKRKIGLIHYKMFAKSSWNVECYEYWRKTNFAYSCPFIPFQLIMVNDVQRIHHIYYVGGCYSKDKRVMKKCFQERALRNGPHPFDLSHL